MPIKTPWLRLIRFVALDDRVYYDDVVVYENDAELDIGIAVTSEHPTSVRAKVITGNPLGEDCKVTDRVEVVKKLLGPLTKDNVSEIRCIGGNYAERL